MIGSTRKRDGRRMTDAEVEAADSHWIQIGATGSAKLLLALIKHHEMKRPLPASKGRKRKGAVMAD